MPFEHEADLIVQGPGGRIAASEAELTQTASGSADHYLRGLAERASVRPWPTALSVR